MNFFYSHINLYVILPLMNQGITTHIFYPLVFEHHQHLRTHMQKLHLTIEHSLNSLTSLGLTLPLKNTTNPLTLFWHPPYLPITTHTPNLHPLCTYSHSYFGSTETPTLHPYYYHHLTPTYTYQHISTTTSTTHSFTPPFTP